MSYCDSTVSWATQDENVWCRTVAPIVFYVFYLVGVLLVGTNAQYQVGVAFVVICFIAITAWSFLGIRIDEQKDKNERKLAFVALNVGALIWFLFIVCINRGDVPEVSTPLSIGFLLVFCSLAFLLKDYEKWYMKWLVFVLATIVFVVGASLGVTSSAGNGLMAVCGLSLYFFVTMFYGTSDEEKEMFMFVFGVVTGTLFYASMIAARWNTTALVALGVVGTLVWIATLWGPLRKKCASSSS